MNLFGASNNSMGLANSSGMGMMRPKPAVQQRLRRPTATITQPKPAAPNGLQTAPTMQPIAPQPVRPVFNPPTRGPMPMDTNPTLMNGDDPQKINPMQQGIKTGPTTMPMQAPIQQPMLAQQPDLEEQNKLLGMGRRPAQRLF